MLTFEIPAVKCHYGVEVNWSRYRDTGVTDPALVLFLLCYLNISSSVQGHDQHQNKKNRFSMGYYVENYGSM